MKKLFRIATAPESLNILLKGQLRYFNQYYKVTAISSPGEELQEVERREGVLTKPISMERQISPVRDLISLYKLYRYFKTEKPHIVHSITPKAGLLSMVAAKFAGVPVRMHTFTGLIFPYKKGLLKYILILTDRLLAACATQIIPEGNGVKEDLERYNITMKPLKIMANGNVNGLDSEYFSPKQISSEDDKELRLKLGISSTDFVFIFVGRLVRDKGVNELVSAFKHLVDFPDDTKMIKRKKSTQILRHQVLLSNDDQKPQMEKIEGGFYGSTSFTKLRVRSRLGRMLSRSNVSFTEKGKYRDSETIIPTISQDLSDQTQKKHRGIKLLLIGSLEQRLDPVLNLTLTEIQKNPHIISTGFVKDVRPYLHLSDCLVLPSYREGFPNAVLQAGAMDLPCIVTDISGSNEIIEDHYNGLIIPKKDENALYEAMKKLSEDEMAYNNLKKNTRDKIIEDYSHFEVWNALLKEYRKAIEVADF